MHEVVDVVRGRIHGHTAVGEHGGFVNGLKGDCRLGIEGVGGLLVVAHGLPVGHGRTGAGEDVVWVHDGQLTFHGRVSGGGWYAVHGSKLGRLTAVRKGQSRTKDGNPKNSIQRNQSLQVGHNAGPGLRVDREGQRVPRWFDARVVCERGRVDWHGG